MNIFRQIAFAADGTGTGTGTENAAASSEPWHKGSDAETIGYLQNRGWDKLDVAEVARQAVKSHREAEKLIGVPQEKLIRIPEQNDVEGWNKVYGKLGVPADAKEYDFSALKGSDGNPLKPEAVGWLQNLAHTLKLSKPAAAEMIQQMQKATADQNATAAAAAEAAAAADEAKLKQDWGTNYNANKIIAENAGIKLGLTAEQVNGEAPVPKAQMMELMRKIGSQIGEDKFINSGGGPDKGPMTVEEAKYKLDALKNDSVWWEKYQRGDARAAKEFNDLTRMVAGHG